MSEIGHSTRAAFLTRNSCYHFLIAQIISVVFQRLNDDIISVAKKSTVKKSLLQMEELPVKHLGSSELYQSQDELMWWRKQDK